MAIGPREELRVLFRIFDTEGQGSIDARELKSAFRALGIPASVDQIRQMMAGLGHDINDVITYEEFCALAEGRLPKADSRDAILQTFELLGGGNDRGYIDFRQLKLVRLHLNNKWWLEACQELGENIPDSELQLMIQEADRNKDGLVDFEDFMIIMRRKYDPLGFDSD